MRQENTDALDLASLTRVTAIIDEDKSFDDLLPCSRVSPGLASFSVAVYSLSSNETVELGFLPDLGSDIICSPFKPCQHYSRVDVSHCQLEIAKTHNYAKIDYNGGDLRIAFEKRLLKHLKEYESIDLIYLRH